MGRTKNKWTPIGRAAVGVLLFPFHVATGLLMVPLLCLGQLSNWLITFTADGTRTFFAPSLYPWTSELQSNWRLVRADLERVVRHLDDVPNYQDLSSAQRVLSRDDKWKSFIFSVFGRKIERNCQECPDTARILDGIPGLCYAMFSILKPTKHIPAHCGPYRGVLNCHLALVVPEKRNDCRLRVGEDVATWEEGCMLIFDDHHQHEAWNDSDALRAVLLMYVVRPLPFPLSGLNRFLLRLVPWTAYMQSLMKQANENATHGQRIKA